jgi:hypothetical protein
MTISDTDFMNRVRPTPDQKAIISVSLHSGEVYRSGESFGDSKTRIVRMFEREDGGVIVYYLPEIGTKHDQNKAAFITTFGHMAVKAVTEVARYDVWKSDLISMVEAEEEGEDFTCPVCDTVIENEDLTACPACGASLEEEPEATPPPEPALPPPPQVTANGQ